MTNIELRQRAKWILATYRYVVLARQNHVAAEAPATETWLHGKHVSQEVFTTETKAASLRATTRTEFSKACTEEVIIALAEFAVDQLTPPEDK